MSEAAVGDPEKFCSSNGVTLPFEMERIRAGRNSEVWRLSNADGCWILKNYHQNTATERDRLGTEFAFLEFLNSVGVRGVARPLGIDRPFNRALYSFLPGNRPSTITARHITQAASFVAEVNEHRTAPEAVALGKASEACFSLRDHLELTEGRIGRLMAITPESGVRAEAHAFLHERVHPHWIETRDRLVGETESSDLEKQLPANARVLSPSDFGFHNTLEVDGDLLFLDFEYAGWDDPAKLICDFICQPELPVTGSQGRQFVSELLANVPDRGGVERRAEKLLPVHRLKWVSILLNEFRPCIRLRRLHAGIDSDGSLPSQLAKAKKYFDMHLAHFN